jgi:hypothetical protein
MEQEGERFGRFGLLELVVEIEAVEALLPVHEAQLIS